MKSVFISILMFIVLFTALKFNILVVFEGRILFYISIICFVCVIVGALFFVGLPKKNKQNQSNHNNLSSSNDVPADKSSFGAQKQPISAEEQKNEKH